LEGFVAVTVYVLAVEADVLAVFEPLLQTKVAPAVVDVACKVSEVLTQFKTVSIPALTVGKVLFKVTITASDAVHPLIVFVTVTVKVPADETEVFALFVPLLHAKVTPAVDEVASNPILFLTQVNEVSTPAFALGALGATKVIVVSF